MIGPFLTDLDSRAAIKGSRDPLGIQPIWARLGRNVVGNLTTVSTSVRDFTVLMVGCYLAEQVAENAGPGTEPDTFLKWEQLAAYARAHVLKDTSFRGTERVHANLAGKGAVLSASSRHQILSNQKTYGLWGLYTMPSRASAILEGTPSRLTAPARELVEACYMPALDRAHPRGRKGVAELLVRDTTTLDLAGSHQRLLQAVADTIGGRFGARELCFYNEHLVAGGPNDSTEGRQRQLSDLFAPHLSTSSFPWSPSALRKLGNDAERRGAGWEGLSDRLLRIADAETVLAPASDLFGYLQGCHGLPTIEIAKRLRHAWGPSLSTLNLDRITALRGELGGADDVAGERWVSIAHSLASGEYRTLVGLLLAQNHAVMQERGGASAWMDQVNERIHVRLADERGILPDREKLPLLWRFPYFLNSLFFVAHQLGGRP